MSTPNNFELCPSTRRKSCAACIRGKRRCNRDYPKCSRCAKLRLDCDYSLVQQPEGEPSVRAGSVSNPGIAAIDDLFDFDPTSIQWTGSLVDLEDLPDAVLNLPEAQAKDLFPSLPNGMNAYKDAPSRPLLIERSYRVPIERASIENLPSLIELRLQYGLNIVKSAPEMIVERGETPWIHAKLYASDTPRVIQDAVSACALYLARNNTNESIVWNNIYTRLEDFMSSSPPSDVRDQLARVHALLLYLIMLAHDGGVSCFSC